MSKWGGLCQQTGLWAWPGLTHCSHLPVLLRSHFKRYRRWDSVYIFTITVPAGLSLSPKSRICNVVYYNNVLLGSYTPVSVLFTLLLTMTKVNPKLYLKCFMCYKPVSTLGFHPEALPTSELHPGPPQQSLELQDQTCIICVSLRVQLRF